MITICLTSGLWALQLLRAKECICHPIAFWLKLFSKQQVSGPFLTYKLGGGKCPPVSSCAPQRNHILPPRKSPFFLKLYKQTREEKQIDKRKESFRLYPLSLFNKIDLNCYVFLPLSIMINYC
jgi:hypothetical protein